MKAQPTMQALDGMAEFATASSGFALLVLGLMIFATTPAAAQQMTPSWVWPTHPTSEPVEKQLTVVDVYRYTERAFTPPFTVEAVAKNERRSDTPEQAAISRFSSMIKLDYGWWNSTWLPDARPLIAKRNLAQGRDSDFWIQWWRDTFRYSQAQLLRRIDSGDYAILIYRYVTSDGKNAANDLELPMVLRAKEGAYYATPELSADEFLKASPWVTGQAMQETTVR